MRFALVSLGILIAASAPAHGQNGPTEAPPGAPTAQAPADTSMDGVGEVSVDRFTGELGHRIPILVPAYHGLEPRLQLAYHSSGGNGFVGMGWSLSGFSSIQRASPGKGAPTYLNGDIFLLDGTELVPCAPGSVSPSCTGGPSGPAYYSTKIESYQRIAFDPSTNIWTVTRTNGTTTTYSPTYITGRGVFRWGIQRVADRRGNAVNYAWSCATDPVCIPSAVTYNGITVSLLTEARPDPVATADGYDLRRTSRRLKAIDVCVRVPGAAAPCSTNGTDPARARIYLLSYRTSTATGRSLVTTIQQYGNDAVLSDAFGTVTVTSGTALPATTADYPTAPAAPFSFQTLWTDSDATYNGWTSAFGDQLIPGDFNGDGRSDFLVVSQTDAVANCTYDPNQCNVRNRIAIFWATGNPSAPFTSTLVWGSSGTAQTLGQCYLGWCSGTMGFITLGDFDADGKIDVMLARRDAQAIFWSTGDPSAPFTSPTWMAGGPLSQPTRFNGLLGTPPLVADYNGDGAADFINRAEREASGALCLSPASRAAWGSCITLSNWGLYPHVNTPTVIYNGSWGPALIIPADFNGDGKADILVHANTDMADNPSAVYLLTATGDPNNPFTYSTVMQPGTCYEGWCSSATDQIIVGEFNGDGKADLFVYHDTVGCCDLNSCYTCACWNYPDGSYGCDHADGHHRAVFFGTGNPTAPFHVTDLWSDAACNGIGTSCYGDWTPSGFDRATVGDFNGDGLGDLLIWNSMDGYGARFTATGNDAQPFTSQSLWTQTPGTGIGQSCYAGYCLRYQIIPEISDRFAVRDFDGDGAADLLSLDPNTGARGVFFSTTSGTDLVTSLANGYGGTTTVTYKTSPTFQNTNLPFVLRVVASITQVDGFTTAKRSFDYSGGLWDAFERDFLGFRNVKETMPCLPEEGTSCPYIETRYMQSRASTSSPEEIDMRRGDGTLLSSQQFEYATNASTLPYTSLPTGNLQIVYDGSVRKRVYSAYSYDAYGNRTVEYEYGDFDVAGDERMTATAYAYNTGAYIVSLPSQVDVHAGLSSTGPRVARTLFYYDGATAETTPPVVGNQTMVRRLVDDAASTYTSRQYVFDEYGNVLDELDERNGDTKHTYDPTYHVFSVSTRDALNHLATVDYDFQLPLSGSSCAGGCLVPVRMTDSNGSRRELRYDALARAVRTDGPGLAYSRRSFCAPNSTTNTCGATSGTNARFIETDEPSADGNGDQWTRQYLDGLGRTYRTERKGPRTIVVDSVHNARGGLASESRPYYKGDPAQLSTFQYDALDRVTKVTHADSTFATKSYGLTACTTPAPGSTCAITTSTDELGHPASVVLDAFGRTIEKRDARGTTRTTYNARGTATDIFDAAGNHWMYQDDALGRVTTADDPDRGMWTYSYDAAGNLIEIHDSLGQVTQTSFDALQRPTSRTTRAGTPQASTVSWSYDAPSSTNGIGRLTRSTDPTGFEDLSYDEVGRITSFTRTVGGIAYTTTRGFDPSGRLLWTIYPDADTVGTATTPLRYDAAGRMTSIPGVVTSTTYDAEGHIAQQTNANGTSTTYGYFAPRGWISSISTTVAGSSTPLQDLVLRHDNAGELTLRTSSNCGDGWSYSYDSVGRLTYALAHGDATKSVGYQYDNVDNITRSSQRGLYQYPLPGQPRPHAVTTIGTSGYNYDANGNLVSGGGRTITYDGAGRPVQVNGASYTYDADGARVSARVNSVTTLYIGDDFETTGGVGTKYIRLGGVPVAKRTGTTTSWLHVDERGSVHVVSDASGHQVQRMSYTPYGDSALSGIGYIGERRDDTGLIYLHARYYDPAIGKFLSADPLSPLLAGVGVNRYAYAHDNPIGRSDPGGLDDEDGYPSPDPPHDCGDEACLPPDPDPPPDPTPPPPRLPLMDIDGFLSELELSDKVQSFAVKTAAAKLYGIVSPSDIQFDRKRTEKCPAGSEACASGTTVHLASDWDWLNLSSDNVDTLLHEIWHVGLTKFNEGSWNVSNGPHGKLGWYHMDQIYTHNLINFDDDYKGANFQTVLHQVSLEELQAASFAEQYRQEVGNAIFQYQWSLTHSPAVPNP